jgi:hypothetical protein
MERCGTEQNQKTTPKYLGVLYMGEGTITKWQNLSKEAS